MNHPLFISIRENFVKLLKDGNNSYKYVRQYREKINKYIEEDETILKQLLYMLLVIYSEKEKCRFHTNDDIAAKIEKDIITDALKILKEDKYKDQKIIEINELAKTVSVEPCAKTVSVEPCAKTVSVEPCAKTIDKSYFLIYERKYGFPANINTNEITEITDENARDIYTNFNTIKKLLELTEDQNEKYKEIYDYLFCLYYFSKPLELVTS
jgi:hypothetical protein